uniref:Membrane spanning 4-domains A8 n=1 Tax=Catagonus wagneri TaxID=51154 RepID=A0A8C3YVU9_9CETA
MASVKLHNTLRYSRSLLFTFISLHLFFSFMNSMSSAGPMANSMFVVTSPNGYTVLPPGMSQVPLYPSYQPQVQVIHGNPPGSEASVGQLPAQRTLKEGKTLGAVQILIGLFHLGLGSIMATIFMGQYVAISFYGGFPFWGGISVSNSLVFLSHPDPLCLLQLNSSLGFNIVSAVFSMTGVCLFVVDLIISPPFVISQFAPSVFCGVVTAISGISLIFCLLEFCVACASAHFGCQLVCYQSKTGVIFPNAYVANPVVIPEPENMPPDYSHVQDGK